MYKRSGNAVFALNYHLIIVVKYRRKVLTTMEIINDLKTLVIDVSNNHGVEIVTQECGDDHIHILFRSKPSCNIPNYVNSVKGYTSRILRENHMEHISQTLTGDAFWSPSYFLATAGNVSIETLHNYINNQRIE